MTTRDGFDGVEVLLPARVHQERARFVAALRAELAAIIAGLPTAGTGKGASAARCLPPTRNPRETDDDGYP